MQMVLMIYDLFSWKKETIIRIKTQQSSLQNLAWSEDCSLCSHRSSSITFNLIVSPHPSPCCPCLCWASTAYLSPFWQPWPALTPLPNTDPFSLRSQAIAASMSSTVRFYLQPVFLRLFTAKPSCILLYSTSRVT
jgi:hypothetical protein